MRKYDVPVIRSEIVLCTTPGPAGKAQKKGQQDASASA